MLRHPTMLRLMNSAAAVRKAFSGAVKTRLASDMTVTRNSSRIIRVEGGIGYTVSIFGATGQLGRYLVNRLARRGCTVVIPFREEMSKRHLKVAGDLGKVNFITSSLSHASLINIPPQEFDLRNTASIETCVRHSDAVYNLIGRNYPTKNFSLQDVHVEGTERIVAAVKKYHVGRYIQVSSYNANPASSSEFYASKACSIAIRQALSSGRGENIARDNFPETTLVRPAPIFGFEDNLLIKLASAISCTANNMQQHFWPVHSIDVGEALEKMLYDDSATGQTFELYGPKEYTMAQIKAMVDKEIFKQRWHLNVPKAVLKPVAGMLNRLLWWNTLSADEVEREFIDQTIDTGAKTFKDLGIVPGDIYNFTYHYLQGFRSSSFYDLPPTTEKEKREARKYIHVLNEL
ncbi:hypothetical protein L249_7457 [Ophiocordyceps polyrhachis-furcata BCC 54312]|uniref:NAD-dependent epimerase/dehydratase domain-containing protein n=1 Tax=Ophiocordyceps polyrhachis-furcata BCC 54312 TaxID=1330021 RepID=A0A367LBS6_9HYPO|nr:hypothetical protein L249_7457 [Ophiocordyceps polyrhachis-furcata BCC 54312]